MAMFLLKIALREISLLNILTLLRKSFNVVVIKKITYLKTHSQIPIIVGNHQIGSTPRVA